MGSCIIIAQARVPSLLMPRLNHPMLMEDMWEDDGLSLTYDDDDEDDDDEELLEVTTCQGFRRRGLFVCV